MGKGTDHGGLFKARLTQAINDGETCFTHNFQEYNTKEASYVLRMEGIPIPMPLMTDDEEDILADDGQNIITDNTPIYVWDAVYGGSAAEPEPEPEPATGTTWYYKVAPNNLGYDDRAILTLYKGGTYKMMSASAIVKVSNIYRWFMGNWIVAEDGRLIAQHEHYNSAVPSPSDQSLASEAHYEEGQDEDSDSVFPPWAYRSDNRIYLGGSRIDGYEFSWRLWNTETGQNQESLTYQWNDSMFFNFMNWTKMEFVDNPTIADIPN